MKTDELFWLWLALPILSVTVFPALWAFIRAIPLIWHDLTTPLTAEEREYFRLLKTVQEYSLPRAERHAPRPTLVTLKNES